MTNAEEGPTDPKQFFSRYADSYAKSKSHAEGPDLARLLELLSPHQEDVALDLATGTGFTAMQLAKLVRQVIAVDLTGEMLNKARELAFERGIKNVRFELADVSSLQFENDSFDLVTTRRAAHHFKDIPKMLSESKRVLKQGGKLGVVDMSPPEDVEDFFNEIERLRDSTHNLAFSPIKWQRLVSDAGLSVTHVEVLEEDLTLERWLYPVNPEGSEALAVRNHWKRASESVKKLMKAREESGSVVGWTKPRIILVAEKNDSRRPR